MVGIVGSVLNEDQKRLINNARSSTSASTTTNNAQPSTSASTTTSARLSDNQNNQGGSGSESLTVPVDNDVQMTTTDPSGGQGGGNQQPLDDLAQSPGYEVETLDLPESETVQGQVADITSKDSPLMKRARTGARQTANQRGLVNSSIAAGAGERAAIDAATPIATRDAEMAFNTRRANQDATNQMRSQRLSGTQNLQQLGAQTESQMQLNEQQAEFDQVLQQMRGDQSERIANIESRAQMLSQASQSASVVYSQSASAIGNILANPDIPVDQKGQLISKQYELLDSSLAFIGQTGNVDLSGIIDTGGGGGQGGGTDTGQDAGQGVGTGPGGGQGGRPGTGPGGGHGTGPSSGPSGRPGIGPGGGQPGSNTGVDTGSSFGPRGVGLQGYREMVNESLQQQGEPNEAFVTDALERADTYDMPASNVFSVLSQHFPDVGYNQFLTEVRNRGYEVGPDTDWQIRKPGGGNNAGGAGPSGRTGGYPADYAQIAEPPEEQR